MKKCPSCGERKALSTFGRRTQDGKEYPKSLCRTCSRSSTRRYRGLNPAARLLASCKARAKREGVPFDLVETDLTIPEVCPVLGIPLVPDYRKRTPATPSVDRRVPSSGYVRGNVAVISWRANRLKSDATPEEIAALHHYTSQ